MTRASVGKPCGPPDDAYRFRLDGPSRILDPRVNAFRDDLCDMALAGAIFAPHYAAALPHVCVAPSAMVRGKPDPHATAVSQVLHGETFYVLDIRGGWTWGRCAHDGYVGYVAVAALRQGQAPDPMWRVRPGGALVFSAPDIKSPHRATLPPGALLSGTMEDMFLASAPGHVHKRHLAPLGDHAADPVAVARSYLGMPYLWGGRGGDGIDCSGLIQMALGLCGIAVLRDSDQQAETVGEALTPDDCARGGDIVFFPGHVGIMSDAETLIHANAHWMAVVEEPLADVLARMAEGTGITARRRLGS